MEKVDFMNNAGITRWREHVFRTSPIVPKWWYLWSTFLYPFQNGQLPLETSLAYWLIGHNFICWTYLLFWYQVFTWVSVRFRSSATFPLSATERYFCDRNLRSRNASWAWVKAVRRRRGFLLLQSMLPSSSELRRWTRLNWLSSFLKLCCPFWEDSLTNNGEVVLLKSFSSLLDEFKSSSSVNFENTNMTHKNRWSIRPKIFSI